MRLSLLLVFAVLCFTQCIQSAKILAVFPVVSYSHYTLGSRIMKELAARGHEVTMLSPYTEKNAGPNYRALQLTGFEATMEEMKKNANMFELTGKSKFISLFFMHFMGYSISEDTLKHPVTKKLIQSKEKYDLVIIEQFADEALYGFCHHFNAPCVSFSAIAPSYWVNLLVANPTNPSYIPEMVLSHAGPMSFCKRLKNTALAVYTQILMHLYILPQQDALMHQYFPTAPPLVDIMHNTSLVLVNSHISTAQAVPMVPNMIEIGGFHPSAPKKLPEDLQTYLDGAKGGIVYFSMGSNLKSKEMSMEKRKALLDTFSKLKMPVLWKFEEDMPEKPANVKISKWLPQQDVLAHPNVKLFITHGGLLSTIEAIYHGVPVVGIPVFGDQATNMIQAVQCGFAEVVDYSTLSEEKLTSAIQAVLTDKRYTENIKLRSKVMHDRPMKPMDTAMYWLEYVIRHKGAPHLKSTAMELTWYQYFLLDIIAFMTLISIVSSYIFVILIKKLFRKKKSDTNNTNKKNKKNK